MHTMSVLFDVQNILKRRIFKSSRMLELLNSQQLPTFLRIFVHSSSGPRSQKIRNYGKYVPVKTAWHPKTLNFYQRRCTKFLKCDKFQTKVVEKIKTHILCLITFFFSKIASFIRYVEKYCRAGQATDDIRMSPMHFSCWIPKATNTHS